MEHIASADGLIADVHNIQHIADISMSTDVTRVQNLIF